MKIFKKITAAALCFVLTAAALCGCSSKSDMIDFIYPFSGDINSFDPQIASTSDEFLIIENCFEGLVRVLDNGEVQPGVAESWSVSDDGLTYTFKLRQGAKWRIDRGDEENPSKITELMGADFNPDITANDFVFALQRAVSADTASPLFSSVANIVNAVDIHSKKKQASSLGVTASDDYTLVIKLESPDDSFMDTLSTAVAMPCNEEFFYATKGRYGLGLDYTLFNGQFFVSSILEASYVLKQNDEYVGDNPATITDLTLNITDDSSDIPKNLESGYYDCAYMSGPEYETIDDKDITAQPYDNKMWAFILNKNNGLFSNKKLRQAVCLSISDADLSEHSYLSKATTFTPPSCLIGSVSAPEAIGDTVPKQDKEKAQQLWIDGLNETGYTTADLTVIVPPEMENIAKQFVQGIQGSIGKITAYGNDEDDRISFHLKLSVLDEDDFNNAFTNGEYDLALYKFEASNQSAVSFLSDIINGNYLGDSSNINAAMKKALSANADSAASACAQCEKEMMSDYSVMPVLFESSYYVQAKGVSGVQFHAGSGRVNFVNATRED